MNLSHRVVAARAHLAPMVGTIYSSRTCSIDTEALVQSTDRVVGQGFELGHWDAIDVCQVVPRSARIAVFCAILVALLSFCGNPLCADAAVLVAVFPD